MTTQRSALPSPSVASELVRDEGLPWGTPGSFPRLPVEKGYLRGGVTTLSAQTDAEAVAIWLAEKARGSKHTADRYRLEAERFLLWCGDQGKCVSQLNREDFLLFARFLENPTPSEKWISPRRLPKTDPGWRPFVKQPLSKRSQHGCLSIIYGLMSWLQSTGWLVANPMPKPKVKVGRKHTGEIKSLNDRHLDAIAHVIAEKRNPIARARMRWIMMLAVFLGPRSADFLEHDMSCFVRVDSKSDIKWGWSMTGKGGVEALLPVPDEVIEALKDFRESINLPPYPTPTERGIPLVPNIARLPRSNLNRYSDLSKYHAPYLSISRSGLYTATKKVFQQSAAWLEEQPEGAHDASKLREASTHWLRHTALKKHFAAHKNLNLTRLLARHANINTTAIYAASDFDELADSMSSVQPTAFGGPK